MRLRSFAGRAARRALRCLPAEAVRYAGSQAAEWAWRPKVRATPTVVIAEPCLRSMEGHPFEYTTTVGDLLARRGADVHIFGHRHLDQTMRGAACNPQLQFHNVFTEDSFTTISSAPGTGPLLRDARVFAADIAEALVRAQIPQPRLIFFCTSNPAQILGASLLRLAFRRAVREAQVHLVRYDPKVPEIGRAVPDLAPTHRWAFARVRRFAAAHRVNIVSDSESIAASLRDLGADGASAFPIPVGVRPRAVRPTVPQVVGFVGGARVEKGMLLLPEIVTRILDGTRDVRFVAQVNLHHQEPALVDAVAKLRAIASECDRLTVLEHPLTTAEYRKLLEDVDIFVIPYDAKAYAARTSGICTEAMVAAKVIVGPGEGWIGEQGASYGGYLGVDTSLPEVVASATLRAVSEFAVLAAKAETDARRFAFHSPESLVQVLLELGRPALGDGK